MNKAIIILALLAFVSGAQAATDKQKEKEERELEAQEMEAFDVEVMAKELDEPTDIIRIYDEEFNLVREVESNILDVDMETFYLINQSSRLMDDGTVTIYQLK